MNPKNYLIVGITENWRRAFDHNPPVWGLTERERVAWDALQSGDVVYPYAAREARGIICKGIVLNKFQSQDPYWQKEIEVGRAKWPLHFYIQPVRLLPPDIWLSGKGPVACSEFGIPGSSIQGKQIVPLSPEQVTKIEERISSWPVVRVGTSKPVEEEPAIMREPYVEYSMDSHTDLLEVLVEMGKLQNFYPQTEFSIPEENRRIDVIWRREVRGTPTYAFEVELSGGLDKAINKLYRCYRLWSTLPRLIAPSSESVKVEQIASLQEPRFKDLVISVSPEKIMDIYGKKKDFKNREREIGLL